MFGIRSKKVTEASLESAPKQFSQGDRDAFKLLYDTYSLKVYRYCLKMLGNEKNAEDAFQETFARVFENQHKFDGKNFTGWIFTIARNNCMNHFRNHRDLDSYDEFEHISPFQSSNETDILLKEHIDLAISKLPVSYREAIILREYEDCSYSEIAQILNVDISLAKIRVFRGRTMLKELLEPIMKELNEAQ